MLFGDTGSAASEYAKGKQILGVAFAVNIKHLISDANQDNLVNVRDCATIAHALAYKEVDQLPCILCADYNEDGEITVRDAVQLANFLAHKKIIIS